MRMHLKAVLLLLGFFVVQNLSAQEDTQAFPEIILERNWYHFSQGITWHQYQYLDGTLLKYKNVRSIISVVPENETILRQERGWLVTNAVSATLFFSSWVVWSIYTNDDLPNAGLMRQIAGYTSFGTFFAAIYAKDIRNHKMRQAVTNYNLYIQGISIP